MLIDKYDCNIELCNTIVNRLNMDEKKEEREEILALAENTKYYCDLLIKQCDSRLSEEEAANNLGRRRTERSKIKKIISEFMSDNF